MQVAGLSDLDAAAGVLVGLLGALGDGVVDLVLDLLRLGLGFRARGRRGGVGGGAGGGGGGCALC